MLVLVIRIGIEHDGQLLWNCETFGSTVDINKLLISFRVYLWFLPVVLPDGVELSEECVDVLDLDVDHVPEAGQVLVGRHERVLLHSQRLSKKKKQKMNSTAANPSSQVITSGEKWVMLNSYYFLSHN